MDTAVPRLRARVKDVLIEVREKELQAKRRERAPTDVSGELRAFEATFKGTAPAIEVDNEELMRRAQQRRLENKKKVVERNRAEVRIQASVAKAVQRESARSSLEPSLPVVQQPTKVYSLSTRLKPVEPFAVDDAHRPAERGDEELHKQLYQARTLRKHARAVQICADVAASIVRFACSMMAHLPDVSARDTEFRPYATSSVCGINKTVYRTAVAQFIKGDYGENEEEKEQEIQEENQIMELTNESLMGYRDELAEELNYYVWGSTKSTNVPIGSRKNEKEEVVGDTTQFVVNVISNALPDGLRAYIEAKNNNVLKESSAGEKIVVVLINILIQELRFQNEDLKIVNFYDTFESEHRDEYESVHEALEGGLLPKEADIVPLIIEQVQAAKERTVIVNGLYGNVMELLGESIKVDAVFVCEPAFVLVDKVTHLVYPIRNREKMESAVHRNKLYSIGYNLFENNRLVPVMPASTTLNALSTYYNGKPIEEIPLIITTLQDTAPKGQKKKTELPAPPLYLSVGSIADMNTLMTLMFGTITFPRMTQITPESLVQTFRSYIEKNLVDDTAEQTELGLIEPPKSKEQEILQTRLISILKNTETRMSESVKATINEAVGFTTTCCEYLLERISRVFHRCILALLDECINDVDDVLWDDAIKQYSFGPLIQYICALPDVLNISYELPENDETFDCFLRVSYDVFSLIHDHLQRYQTLLVDTNELIEHHFSTDFIPQFELIQGQEQNIFTDYANECKNRIDAIHTAIEKDKTCKELVQNRELQIIQERRTALVGLEAPGRVENNGLLNFDQVRLIIQYLKTNIVPEFNSSWVIRTDTLAELMISSDIQSMLPSSLHFEKQMWLRVLSQYACMMRIQKEQPVEQPQRKPATRGKQMDLIEDISVCFWDRIIMSFYAERAFRLSEIRTVTDIASQVVEEAEFPHIGYFDLFLNPHNPDIASQFVFNKEYWTVLKDLFDNKLSPEMIIVMCLFMDSDVIYYVLTHLPQVCVPPEAVDGNMTEKRNATAKKKKETPEEAALGQVKTEAIQGEYKLVMDLVKLVPNIVSEDEQVLRTLKLKTTLATIQELALVEEQVPEKAPEVTSPSRREGNTPGSLPPSRRTRK